ncbi:MAG: FAD-dependent monooxygenase, partial [Thiotrichales bacterium]|nr:FAD-dependent monooxygenase [Thiotrichales bacterium]
MVAHAADLASDVVIVGGGINGLVMAGLLAAQGCRVALIEARPSQEVADPAATDPRTLAITLASARVLQSLGAWQQIIPARIGHFRSMQVWDENGPGRIRFDCTDLFQDTLGYIVGSQDLQRALQAVVSERPEVNVYQPAQVASVAMQTDRAVVALADGRHLNTRLVVAADGKDSHIRSLAGIGFSSEAYAQTALACIVRTGTPHRDVARQRFLSDGTLAFLPTADPQVSGIVWSTESRECRRLHGLDTAQFHTALAAAIDHVLGDVLDSGPRVCFPLSYGMAERFIETRLALIGDAAHV